MALSVAGGVAEEFRRDFATNLDHVVQQMESKLAAKVKVISDFPGKQKTFNDLESFELEERTGRLTASTPTEIELHARTMTKRSFKKQIIFDKDDKDFLGALGRPDSEVLEEFKAAINRNKDTRIVEAAQATVYGGAEPYVTPIDLATDAANSVAANYDPITPAQSGMTPNKILRACSIAEERELDPLNEEWTLYMNPKAKQDLFTYVQTATNDVWAGAVFKWLENPTQKLLGMRAVVTNDVVVGAGDITDCFAVCQRKGIWTTPGTSEVKIDLRADLDHAAQLSVYHCFATMRRYEKGVIVIKTDESP